MIWVRVVCGLSETIVTFVPRMRLSSVDLPTLGRPTRVTKPERISASLAAAGAGSTAWRRWMRTRPMRRPTTRSAVSCQPSTSTDSPSTGHVAELGEEQAADRVPVALGQLGAQQVVDLVDGHARR